MDESEVIMTIDKIGTKRWRNKSGKLHRLDGPAVEFTNGNKYWHKNGLLHRLDGPAFITANGHKEWVFRDILHREDGPAIIYADGSKNWYLSGVRYRTKEEYFDALSDEAKSRCLFSEDFLNG